MEWSQQLAGVFGKLKKLTEKEKKALKDKDEAAQNEALMTELEIEQLAHFSPEEEQAIEDLIKEIAVTGEGPTQEQLGLLRKQHSAADIALFGRMLASNPAFNTEAAAQVAHAISVHKITVEDDFFTAVDDLNNGEEDMGAGHMGETEFAAGLFYQYLCIDRDLLTKNLSGDQDLANKTLAALIESAATVAPNGKQNSFASRARASYILCEKGDQQPRSLSVAFLKPISGNDPLTQSIEALNQTRNNMDAVYGDGIAEIAVMNALKGEGSLKAVIDYATGE
jgi:CRISPR system Cascade subunit CasC